jgi:chorismate dehydratase
MTAAMRPRIGHIQFLNCFPLYYGLLKNGILADIELCKNSPTELCDRLLRGDLDISPVPSIEYARHTDKLLLLPKLTVSSDGKVLSILIVSKTPIQKLDGKPVALANTSATSQILAKIILQEKYHVRPLFFESPPDLPEMFREAEAALLIGDAALRVFAKPKNFYLYDLGEEWKLLTGEKMVYAVWAVRKTFAAKHPVITKKVYHAFEQSMKQSVDHLEDIAKDAARWEPFPVRFLKEYFKGLKFEFGKEYQRGYVEFLRRAKHLGSIEKIPKLEFIEID